jgi:hypothetical protein
VALCESTAGLPPSASTPLLQSASQQLAGFGRTPVGADRLGVSVREGPESDALNELVEPVPLRAMPSGWKSAA